MKLSKKSEKKLFDLHAEICKVFANPKRLEILNSIREKELTVSELVELLDVRKANVSQHLAVLRQKGVVHTRRDGLNIYYSISDPKIIEACDLMRKVLLKQLREGNRLIRRMK
jgi:ArsR family transcriptional regulator